MKFSMVKKNGTLFSKTFFVANLSWVRYSRESNTSGKTFPEVLDSLSYLTHYVLGQIYAVVDYSLPPSSHVCCNTTNVLSKHGIEDEVYVPFLCTHQFPLAAPGSMGCCLQSSCLKYIASSLKVRRSQGSTRSCVECVGEGWVTSLLWLAQCWYDIRLTVYIYALDFFCDTKECKL